MKNLSVLNHEVTPQVNMCTGSQKNQSKTSLTNIKLKMLSDE